MRASERAQEEGKDEKQNPEPVVRKRRTERGARGGLWRMFGKERGLVRPEHAEELELELGVTQLLSQMEAAAARQAAASSALSIRSAPARAAPRC
jgi:hypothetical protein